MRASSRRESSRAASWLSRMAVASVKPVQAGLRLCRFGDPRQGGPFFATLELSKTGEWQRWITTEGVPHSLALANWGGDVPAHGATRPCPLSLIHISEPTRH